MPGLTVTEKEHWKNRIALRIEKRIETIIATDRGFFDRIHRDARQRAMESLGLVEIQTELDQIERQTESLETRANQLRKQMLAQVRGVDVEEVTDGYSYHLGTAVPQAIDRRKVVHEEELLADSELGRQILQLRQEKENLLDTVWLATSPRQIRTLWSKVAELLGDAPTRLEQDALEIEPIED